MRIIKGKNYEEMSRKAANIIAAQVTLKNDSVLGLATGSTPIGLYKSLIADYNNGDLNFSKVKTVNLDEYCGLDGNNDQSYRYFMNENLFKHVNVDLNNTNVPNGMAADPDAESARYDQVIESMGGVDIQLLGIGHNGHIGFNEPNTEFDKTTHCVDLTQKTIDANARFFATIDDVPKKAITMGVGAIMKAKCVMLVANGEAKAQIMYDAFFGPVTPSVPASILQFHPNLIIVGDEEALKLISEKCPEAIEA